LIDYIFFIYIEDFLYGGDIVNNSSLILALCNSLTNCSQFQNNYKNNSANKSFNNNLFNFSDSFDSSNLEKLCFNYSTSSVNTSLLNLLSNFSTKSSGSVSNSNNVDYEKLNEGRRSLAYIQNDKLSLIPELGQDGKTIVGENLTYKDANITIKTLAGGKFTVLQNGKEIANESNYITDTAIIKKLSDLGLRISTHNPGGEYGTNVKIEYQNTEFGFNSNATAVDTKKHVMDNGLVGYKYDTETGKVVQTWGYKKD